MAPLLASPAPPFALFARFSSMLLVAFVFSVFAFYEAASDPLECYYGDGSAYKGVNYTSAASGDACLSWTSNQLTNLATSLQRDDLRWKLTSIRLALLTLEGNASHSFCRNAISSGTEPWCYTVKTSATSTAWGYCAIPLCSEICAKQSPCQNNGYCATWSNNSGYTCLCATGWTGSHCRVPTLGNAPSGQVSLPNGTLIANGASSSGSSGSSGSTDLIFIILASVLGSLLLIAIVAVVLIWLLKYRKTSAGARRKVKPSSHDSMNDRPFNPYKDTTDSTYYPPQGAADNTQYGRAKAYGGEF